MLDAPERGGRGRRVRVAQAIGNRGWVRNWGRVQLDSLRGSSMAFADKYIKLPGGIFVFEGWILMRICEKAASRC